MLLAVAGSLAQRTTSKEVLVRMPLRPSPAASDDGPCSHSQPLPTSMSATRGRQSQLRNASALRAAWVEGDIRGGHLCFVHPPALAICVASTIYKRCKDTWTRPVQGGITTSSAQRAETRMDGWTDRNDMTSDTTQATNKHRDMSQIINNEAGDIRRCTLKDPSWCNTTNLE